MRERFHLDHIDYEHMSPVIIPQGYTKKYIEGKITHGDQLEKIRQSYKHVSEASDITLLEGTGHCAGVCGLCALACVIVIVVVLYVIVCL